MEKTTIKEIVAISKDVVNIILNKQRKKQKFFIASLIATEQKDLLPAECHDLRSPG